MLCVIINHWFLYSVLSSISRAFCLKYIVLRFSIAARILVFFLNLYCDHWDYMLSCSAEVAILFSSTSLCSWFFDFTGGWTDLHMNDCSLCKEFHKHPVIWGVFDLFRDLNNDTMVFCMLFLCCISVEFWQQFLGCMVT